MGSEICRRSTFTVQYLVVPLSKEPSLFLTSGCSSRSDSTFRKKRLSPSAHDLLESPAEPIPPPPKPSHVFYVETARCQTRGSRRSTGRMLTPGGTDARGRFTESSAEWGGRGRPLTPVEAISVSSYLVYGGAGRGLPYTKYEGPNHALSGVSGRA